jgi:hypothetical protein
MAVVYVWTRGSQRGGCPGEENKINPGWYISGQAKPGVTPIVPTYKNPKTGKRYTNAQLAKIICPSCVVSK